MFTLIELIAYSWFAGLTAFVGGLFAYFEGSAETDGKQEFVHSIVAFGGGILIAAIAFTLAPEAIRILPTCYLVFIFCVGGIAFCLLDYIITKYGKSESQFIAMLLDFIPEALALGSVLAYNHSLGMLLALFIAMQNLPEGFNSFREMFSAIGNTKRILLILFFISFLGPIFSIIGYYLFQGREFLTASIMAFASGGILYLVFEDIAPASTMKKHRTPPLGAVLGFAIGMVGKQIIT